MASCQLPLCEARASISDALSRAGSTCPPVAGKRPAATGGVFSTAGLGPMVGCRPTPYLSHAMNAKLKSRVPPSSLQCVSPSSSPARRPPPPWEAYDTGKEKETCFTKYVGRIAPPLPEMAAAAPAHSQPTSRSTSPRCTASCQIGRLQRLQLQPWALCGSWGAEEGRQQMQLCSTS